LAVLDRAEHDAGELVEGALSAFESVARERGIELALNVPKRRLGLYCDRARIEMALINLVDNALKFTPAGGQVQVGAQQAENGVRLWVRDTGAGIDPQDLPHVFERFYRGRNARAEGSGLGLAIVQSIVQAHGGQVWAESQAGVGSEFSIKLPQE
jgi:signal transduction histidine kinase